MACGFQKLQSHLQGVQKLLGNLQGQPCCEAVAKVQATQVLSSMQGAKLCPDQASTLVEIITASAWPSAVVPKLLEGVSNCISSSPMLAMTGARAKMQSWEGIYQYFTMQQWYCLSDTAVVEEAKLDVILDHAVALGLRSPSEGTGQMLACLHQSAVHGPDKVKVLPHDRLLGAVHHVKRVFKRKITNIAAPQQYVITLPESPSTFMEQQPELFSAIYDNSIPMSCPIPESVLRGFQAMFPMRCTKKSHSMGMIAADGGPLAVVVQQLMQLVADRNHSSGSSSSGGDVRIQLLTPKAEQQKVSQPALADSVADQGADQGADSLEPKPVQKTVEPKPVEKHKKPSVQQCMAGILESMGEKAESSKAKSKAKGKAKAKASPKGKAKGKAKAKATLPISAGLGCSECRYSSGGCSKCRGKAKAKGKA